MKFRTAYDENYNPADYATPVGYDHTKGPEAALEASLTQQSFKDECDVNNIVKTFQQTGHLPEGNGPTARFGDFTDLPTYQEARNIVVEANNAFSELPSNVRERFANDPGKFLDFMSDAENIDEAVKLGLVQRPSPSPEPAAEAVAPAAEKAPAA